MLIAQMAVNSHCKRAAILVSKPAAHRWYIHTGFNANPTFCRSAKEVERQDRDFALDQIAAMIDQTKKEISE